MSDFNKQYKINPKIREIIERKKGIKYNLSHSQIENMMENVFEGKKILDSITDEDKNKVLFYLESFSPNEYDQKELDNFSNFIKSNFDKDQMISIIDKLINKFYHPGRVEYGLKVYNNNIMYLTTLFSEDFKTSKGVIINSKYISDVRKVYSDVEVDENGEIISTDVKDKVSSFVFTLKSKHRENLNVCVKDDIFILSTDSEDIIKELEEMKLRIETIPVFYFNWI